MDSSASLAASVIDDDSSDDEVMLTQRESRLLAALNDARDNVVDVLQHNYETVSGKPLQEILLRQYFLERSKLYINELINRTITTDDAESSDEDEVLSKRERHLMAAVEKSRNDVVAAILNQYQKSRGKSAKIDDLDSLFRKQPTLVAKNIFPAHRQRTNSTSTIRPPSNLLSTRPPTEKEVQDRTMEYLVKCQNAIIDSTTSINDTTTEMNTLGISTKPAASSSSKSQFSFAAGAAKPGPAAHRVLISQQKLQEIAGSELAGEYRIQDVRHRVDSSEERLVQRSTLAQKVRNIDSPTRELVREQPSYNPMAMFPYPRGERYTNSLTEGYESELGDVEVDHSTPVPTVRNIDSPTRELVREQSSYNPMAMFPYPRGEMDTNSLTEGDESELGDVEVEHSTPVPTREDWGNLVVMTFDGERLVPMEGVDPIQVPLFPTSHRTPAKNNNRFSFNAPKAKSDSSDYGTPIGSGDEDNDSDRSVIVTHGTDVREQMSNGIVENSVIGMNGGQMEEELPGEEMAREQQRKEFKQRLSAIEKLLINKLMKVVPPTIRYFIPDLVHATVRADEESNGEKKAVAVKDIIGVECTFPEMEALVVKAIRSVKDLAKLFTVENLRGVDTIRLRKSGVRHFSSDSESSVIVTPQTEREKLRQEAETEKLREERYIQQLEEERKMKYQKRKEEEERALQERWEAEERRNEGMRGGGGDGSHHITTTVPPPRAAPVTATVAPMGPRAGMDYGIELPKREEKLPRKAIIADIDPYDMPQALVIYTVKEQNELNAAIAKWQENGERLPVEGRVRADLPVLVEDDTNCIFRAVLEGQGEEGEIRLFLVDSEVPPATDEPRRIQVVNVPTDRCYLMPLSIAALPTPLIRASLAIKSTTGENTFSKDVHSACKDWVSNYQQGEMEAELLSRKDDGWYEVDLVHARRGSLVNHIIGKGWAVSSVRNPAMPSFAPPRPILNGGVARLIHTAYRQIPAGEEEYW